MRTIALTLLLTASLFAQEKPPFEWKVSGDTVETFKMQLVENHKSDQSSARACVLTCAAYTDNRQATAAMMREVGLKWDAAVKVSMATHESELLTAAAIDGMGQVAEPQAAVVSGVTEILSETEVGETARVETRQSFEVPYKELGTGEWLTQKQEVKLRYDCVKVSGVWRICGIEREVIDEAGTARDGKAPTKWVADAGLLPVIMYALKQDANRAKVPTVSRDTPEAAAKSLFESLIPRRDALTESVRAKGLSAWLEVLKPLFSDEFVKAQDAIATDWLSQKPIEVAREIDTVAENVDGTRTVRFKPLDSLSGAVELRLERDGKQWKIAGGGFYAPGRDENQHAIWKYVPERILYNLKWR